MQIFIWSETSMQSYYVEGLLKKDSAGISPSICTTLLQNISSWSQTTIQLQVVTYKNIKKMLSKWQAFSDLNFFKTNILCVLALLKAPSSYRWYDAKMSLKWLASLLFQKDKNLRNRVSFLQQMSSWSWTFFL